MKILTIECSDTINEFLNRKFNVISVHSGASVFNNTVEHNEILTNVDAVVFGGGLDIDPKLYGQFPHQRTVTTHLSEDRDTEEVVFYWECVSRGIPCIGICRGGQLLATQQGAQLFQHVNNHTSPHKIQTNDKREFWATSTHHQMIDLRNMPRKTYRLLAWAVGVADIKEAMSTESKGANVVHKVKQDIEPEVVYFPEDDTLCIQGHPEFLTAEIEYSTYCLNQIENTITLNKSKKEKETK